MKVHAQIQITVTETFEVDDGWLPAETAPTDGTKFDAWCTTEFSPGGFRVPDVRMRYDGSGFGIIPHDFSVDKPFRYLDARREDKKVKCDMVRWRPIPKGPKS